MAFLSHPLGEAEGEQGSFKHVWILKKAHLLYMEKRFTCKHVMLYLHYAYQYSVSISLLIND